MTGTVLITGASGYMGGRLIPVMLRAGFTVRAMARQPAGLRSRTWADPSALASGELEIVQGDALDPDSLRAAMKSVDVVYFLIHSMGDGAGFVEREQRTAENVATAARAMGVRRIVYLSGLHPSGTELSPHLASRVRVGEVFLASGVPTVVLQAAVILGSGSASFEMMRYLAERLPAMVAPKWVENRIQPIGVDDVLWYLRRVAELPADVNRAFDIGGPDVLTYREMMQRYCAAVGLPPRRIVSVPVLTPRLASRWIGAVTPVPPQVAKPLIGSMVHEVVCAEHDIDRVVGVPEGGLDGFDDATRKALGRGGAESAVRHEPGRGAESSREPAGGRQEVSADGVGERPRGGSAALASADDPPWAGGDRLVDEYRAQSAAASAQVWRVISGVGGETGWYTVPYVWQVRGLLDRMVGGPGHRRDRSAALTPGETLDSWMVERVVAGELVTLRSRMRLPGVARLDLVAVPSGAGTDVVVRVRFAPRGLAGRLYWSAASPAHGVVFGTMATRIAAAAESA